MPRPPKSRFNPDVLLGLSAVFISVCALVVSVVQTKIAREQQQATVWPYLQVLMSQFDQEFHVGIENKGVGPAIIRQFELLDHDRRFTTTQAFYLERFGPTRGGKGFATLDSGSVLKPGENIDLLAVFNNDSVARAVYGYVGKRDFGLRVTYSDVYGNCWCLERDKTTPLARCPE